MSTAEIYNAGGAEQCDVLEVSNNTEIAAGEARKPDLTAKKAKLGESMASARQFRALLQQQLQKTFQSHGIRKQLKLPF